MIDPMETIIKWLAGGLTLAGGRVANKHRFTDGWPAGQSAVSVHEDDIGQSLYGAVHEARVEARLYGNPVMIGDLYRAIAALCTESARSHVVTSQGTALIYYCMLGSGLTTVYDDDLGVDVGVVSLFAMIAQEAVATT